VCVSGKACSFNAGSQSGEILCTPLSLRCAIRRSVSGLGDSNGVGDGGVVAASIDVTAASQTLDVSAGAE